MSVNKHPTHPGWWQIKYYPNGKKGGIEVIVLKGGTREEALEWEAELRRESRGIHQLGLFPTIGEAIPYYIKYYSLDHLDTGKVVKHLDRWNTYIGRFKFASVTPQIIEQYKHMRLAENVKPTTINKELSAFSGLCKYAADKGYCHGIKIKRFPAKLTKAPFPDVPTREEVMALIDGMLWPRCGLFACLYFAGLRASEGTGLKAENIFLDRQCMIVRGKGNKQRVVPIVDSLLPYIVKRLSEVNSGLLWTTRSGKRITDLDKIIKLSQQRIVMTRHITPHSLRHAFGVHATMAGVNMRSLQMSMGHSNVTTTEIYTQLASESIIKEVRKFGKS